MVTRSKTLGSGRASGCFGLRGAPLAGIFQTRRITPGGDAKSRANDRSQRSARGPTMSVGVSAASATAAAAAADAAVARPGEEGAGETGTRRTPTRTTGNRKRRRLGRRLERRATRAEDATRRRLGREIAARPSREWRRPRRVRHLRGRRFGVRLLVSVGARSGTGRDVAGAASGGVRLRLRLRRFFSPRAEERVLRGERDVRSEVTPEREHRRGRARLFAGE